MQLYFIRHAQSTNNHLWISTGSSKGRSEDPKLTEIGIQQADRLADFLCTGSPEGGHHPDGSGSGFGLTHLYASPMLRAVETGARSARALGLPLACWVELHEQGGIYREDEQTGEPTGLPGCDRAYFSAHYPEFVLPPDFIETGWWNRRPREELVESRLRAGRFLAGLVERHGERDDRVAVFSHGGFYMDVVSALLELVQPEKFWFRLNNTALSRVDIVDGEIKFIYHNRVDYLPAELVT